MCILQWLDLHALVLYSTQLVTRSDLAMYALLATRFPIIREGIGCRSRVSSQHTHISIFTFMRSRVLHPYDGTFGEGHLAWLLKHTKKHAVPESRNT